MKRIFKYLMMTVIAAGTMFYSCETTELEDLVSPNALSPDLADADLLLNSIQVSYLGAMQDMQYNGAALGRISYMGGRVYYNNFGSGTVSGAWGSLYSGMLPDIAAIEAQNGEDNLLAFHLGISKAMAAHVMMGIVDSVGDIPWSQANNPTEFPSPSVDDDADVYAAAVAMLDEAESYLNAAGGGDDLFYGGDSSKWMKFVNTLRMRAMLTTGDYAGALAQGGVIDTANINLGITRGVVRQIESDQIGSTAQVAFKLGSKVLSHEWFQSLNPNEIIITLRTPIAQRDKYVERAKERWRLDTVVLDAGHGGKDPGAVGKISYEKNIQINYFYFNSCIISCFNAIKG